MDIVFKRLGVSNQVVSYWRNNSKSTLTKNRLKHRVITAAIDVFGLSEVEGELLANKAGLSLKMDADFAAYFCNLLKQCRKTQAELCQIAQVSVRMLGYMKQGKYLRKEPLTSILITMGLELEDIQDTLQKAGFILSYSLPNDAVVLFLLKNEARANRGTHLIFQINETLDSLGLPLLMTREREKASADT